MEQPINPVWPVHHLRSMDELMDIAVAMEREAAARYEALAAQMHGQGAADLAALFDRLAELEREHGQGLERWAARTGGRPPESVAIAWEMPETFGSEADGPGLTPYDALAVAVRNEERAFSFYSYLAAMADDAAVRQRAESMAREELEHVALLRTMRRKAFHANRPKRRMRVRDLAGLRALAHGLEGEAADLCQSLADSAEGAGDVPTAAVLREVAAAARARADGLAADPAIPPMTRAAVVRDSGVLTAGSLTPVGALRLSVQNADEVLDAYLEAADLAAEEDVLAEAQRLAGSATDRLIRLRARLKDANGAARP